MAWSKFLDPKNDFAFKKLFGTERNQDILIPFLNDMLGFESGSKICAVTFLKPIQDPEVVAKKQSVVDVLCLDEQDRQYIVEMQVAKVKGFEKRAQYYAAKAYVQQLNESEAYHTLKEIIFIAITNFVMFPDKLEYKSDHVVLDKHSNSHDLKDFSFTFLELPKFKKKRSELNTNVEKWAYFFKHADETTEEAFKEITAQNVVLERAYTELNRLSWSEDHLKLYEESLKNALDFQGIVEEAQDKGRKEGIQQGESAFLVRLLEHKFKIIPSRYREKIQQATTEDLLKWGTRVLDSETLEKLFED